MATTWTARQSGDYSAPGNWSTGSLYAVASIVAATKHVVVTGDASGLAGKTVTLLGTTASDGDYTVTTAVHTTTTLLTMAAVGNLVDQVGAAGNVYQDGIPAAGDTADINAKTIALDVAPAAGVTIEDVATGGTLNMSADITLADLTITTGETTTVTGAVAIASGATVTADSLFAISTGTLSVAGSLASVSTGLAIQVGAAGTLDVQAGGHVAEGSTQYTDSAGATLIVNGTFDCSEPSAAFTSAATVTGTGVIAIPGAIGSGGNTFKGTIEDVNGTIFYAVGGRVQSIGAWPADAVSIGPLPIGPTSLGGMPVL